MMKLHALCVPSVPSVLKSQLKLIFVGKIIVLTKNRCACSKRNGNHIRHCERIREATQTQPTLGCFADTLAMTVARLGEDAVALPYFCGFL